MPRFDTAVVSDLHLGARNARPDDFIRFLEWVDADQLIVAGDLVDDPRLRGVDGAHSRAFEALRDYARSRTLVWLHGNHDPGNAWCREVLGIESRDELVCRLGDRTYLICHGHLWDASLDLPSPVIAAADGVYHACQWLDPSHRLARRLKRGSKSFCRVVDSLRRRAIDEARRRSVAGVILGHSHVACDSREDGVHYLNSGCWTERPAGFVGVRDGVARRYSWETALRCSLRAASRLAARAAAATMRTSWEVAPAGGRA